VPEVSEIAARVTAEPFESDDRERRERRVGRAIDERELRSDRMKGSKSWSGGELSAQRAEGRKVGNRQQRQIGGWASGREWARDGPR
jgi:hypothetical protein